MRFSFTTTFVEKLLITICISTCSTMLTAQIKYPQFEKISINDDYFGTKVPDPYRGLEDDTSGKTKEWVLAQNKVAEEYFASIPYYQEIEKKLQSLMNYPKYGSPQRAGEYYFFSKNDGLQNQSITYIQKGLDGKPEIFLDPNKLSDDGTVRSWLAGFSEDKKYVAIATSASGSDWSDITIKEVATDKLLNDKIAWADGGVSWFKNGFYYSQYAKPEAGKEYSNKKEKQKVFYHTLGTDQAADELVYEDKEHPQRFLGVWASEDSVLNFLYESEGTSGNQISVRNLSKSETKFRLLFKGFKDNFHIVESRGEIVFVLTNYKAPNYRLLAVDTKNSDEKNWEEIIPETTELLDEVTTAGNKFFAHYLKDVAKKIFQFDYNGKLERSIELPALGEVWGFGGEKEDKFVFYTFTSFTYPPSIYKYDIATGKSELFRKSEVSFTPSNYETKQVFYESKDGTHIPMYIIYKKGIVLNGLNPTLLYGYGGFNISLMPSFNATNVFFLEQGGVYAVANLRGGGEYGENWHKAGMLTNKQNVFDDFIAAAEYLIKEKYTSSKYLAIEGRSNGGLLIGACMTQRPDLYAVAFPFVGVLDMLRYHKFTVGWAWAVEYGSAEQSKESFLNLYKYSPLHNIKTKVEYPATLILTADHDDRVVPAHSFKFASTLQEKYSGTKPMILKIETKSGHGSSNLQKMIEGLADKFTFMLWNMGVKKLK